MRVSPKTATNDIRVTSIENLDGLCKLADGWDQQGAPAPSEVAIRAARQFIEALSKTDSLRRAWPPPRLAASG